MSGLIDQTDNACTKSDFAGEGGGIQAKNTCSSRIRARRNSAVIAGSADSQALMTWLIHDVLQTKYVSPSSAIGLDSQFLTYRGTVG